LVAVEPDDARGGRGLFAQALARALLPLVLAGAFLLRWQSGAAERVSADEGQGALAWIVDDEESAAALRRAELALATGRSSVHDAAAAAGVPLSDPASPVPAALHASLARLLAPTGGDPGLRGHDEAAVEGALLRLGPLLGLLLAICVHLAARSLLAGSAERSVLLGSVCAAAVAACAHPLVAPSALGRLAEGALGWIAVALLVRSYARLASRDEEPAEDGTPAATSKLVDGVLEGLLGGVLAGIAIAAWAPAAVVVVCGSAMLLRAALDPVGRALRARTALLLHLVAAFALRLPLEEGPWAASEGVWAAWIRGASTLLLVLAAPFAVLLLLSRRRGGPRRVLHVAMLAALVLVAIAWLPEAWREGRAGWPALLAHDPLQARWPGPHLPAMGALLVGAVLVAPRWRDHAGFFVLLLAGASLLAGLVLRDGPALVALSAAFVVAELARAPLHDGSASRIGVLASRAIPVALLLPAFALAGRAADEGLRQERIEHSLGLRRLREVVPSSAPWNDPDGEPQECVLVPAGHAARAILHGRRAVPATAHARLGSAEMEARVAAVEQLARVESFEELARGMRALGATHLVAAPRHAGVELDPAGAWARLSMWRPGEDSGPFKLAWSSPRRVGVDGRALLDARLPGGAACSIWRLEPAASRPAPELRAR
jgi:hypothetical protein